MGELDRIDRLGRKEVDGMVGCSREGRMDGRWKREANIVEGLLGCIAGA